MLSTIPGNPPQSPTPPGICFRNSSIAGTDRGKERVVTEKNRGVPQTA
jgi:hypothetical protein